MISEKQYNELKKLVKKLGDHPRQKQTKKRFELKIKEYEKSLKPEKKEEK